MGSVCVPEVTMQHSRRSLMNMSGFSSRNTPGRLAREEVKDR